MSTPIYSGISVQLVQQRIVSLIGSLRDVLTQLQLEESQWVAFTAAQLEAAGLSSSDYTFLSAALADANGLANVTFTGTDSRNPGAGYVYFNSMKQLVGPLCLTRISRSAGGAILGDSGGHGSPLVDGLDQ